MSDKSVQKKKYILETARGVFAEKGYKSVTMRILLMPAISAGADYIFTFRVPERSSWKC